MKTRNIEIWRNDFELYKKSGLTRKQWCDKQGIAVHVFAYRKKEIKKFDEANNQSSFVKVNDTKIDMDTNSTYSLLFPNGISLVLDNEFNPSSLNSLCEVVLNVTTK